MTAETKPKILFTFVHRGTGQRMGVRATNEVHAIRSVRILTGLWGGWKLESEVQDDAGTNKDTA